MIVYSFWIAVVGEASTGVCDNNGFWPSIKVFLRWPPQLLLSLFFAVLAFGWPLAVRWTEPRLTQRA